MSSLKHILITGTSNISWKDATIKAISDAGETLSNLTSVKILEQRANIQNNKISEYFVDILHYLKILMNRLEDIYER